ncbi:MAG: YebC/PmpR family DNA-binding transcriptional regulator [Gammaproteobacteria bacterium TMED243]|jgi:YebC/PmpR family DNA-binding regulatory protein|nr:YebC/PmpR family DNA-binding transcriptional regulator [Gammaproteobacteria bacterium]MAW42697.1 YebC/PmpR family DNA-binding transcriptional regulator [Gammaproteobacteria bacterium]RPG34107.1 MAG: YebC/PmpR family DNA-binding transcriptional regulator [Gammaproteobacteria bacterium TMED243]|tara:strand:+ start:986 stop:1723 length:738 start_codon:yes stop_codon:yes gene_type:complete
MAGHSKWANIKHRKAAQDKKRGKLYTKLIREITVAARLGGGVVDDNPRLRAAVDKALGANMPKDTIERAIARGAGGGEGNDVEELVYEGYANGGVAILVEAMTDNRNRTVAEVRHAFNKYGGNLGTDGSVAYLFTRQGVINFAPGADEEALMDIALEAGAEDIEGDDEGAITVTTPWETLNQVVGKLTEAGYEPDHSEVTMLASTTSPCDTEQARKVLTLIDVLEDLDDVQEVYSNGEFPDDAYE